MFKIHAWKLSQISAKDFQDIYLQTTAQPSLSYTHNVALMTLDQSC